MTYEIEWTEGSAEVVVTEQGTSSWVATFPAATTTEADKALAEHGYRRTVGWLFGSPTRMIGSAERADPG